jgi:hypothetical protein
MLEQILVIDAAQTAAHFYCGVILNANNPVRAAPIVRYLLYWSRARIEQYCRTRGWHCEVLGLPELSHEPHSQRSTAHR